MEKNEIANHDTPKDVRTPNTWPAFAMWAITRFGVSAILATVSVLALKQVYFDMREDRQQNLEDKRALLEAYRANARVISNFTKAMEQNNELIKDLRREINRNN